MTKRLLLSSFLLASTSLLAGCPSDPSGISWRLPCAATGELDGEVAEQFRYQFDDEGNELLTEVRDGNGALVYTVERTYKDGLVETMTVEGEGIDYSYETQIENGRYLEIVYQNRVDAQWNWAETYTYDDDGDLVRSVLDYADPNMTDTEVTYAATELGFEALSCWAADRCDRITYFTADFVGDFLHWTQVDVDWFDDGELDFRDTRTFDDHGLELTYQASAADDLGVMELWYQSAYDREEDGTALSFEREWLGDFPSTYTLTYAFECEAEARDGEAREAAAARPAEERPSIDRLRPRLQPRGYAPGRAR